VGEINTDTHQAAFGLPFVMRGEEAEAKEAQDQYLSAFVKQKGGTGDGSQDPEEMKDPEGKKDPKENQDPDSKKATGRQKPDKGGTDA
jgi:hypothetical protein